MNLDTIKQRIRAVLDVPQSWAIPLVSVALGYRTAVETTDHGVNHDPSDDETVLRNMWGGHVAFGGSHTRSLFYNGIFFARVVFPFGIFIGIRWAGNNPARKEYLQFGLGHKLNGTFALTFRIQSDHSAAGGVYGPNVGQAQGWSGGPK